MSGAMSRRKGQSGERQAAAYLSELTGHEWSRGIGQSRGGGREVADVVCDSLPGVHVEVKRGKAISLWAAREQAKADAGDGCIALVMARRDRDAFVFLLDADDLLPLARKLWPDGWGP